MLKLKGKIVENGTSVSALAKAIGMGPSTFYHKLNRGGLSFSLEEVNRIVDVLGLTVDEAMSIFFADHVA